MNIGVVDWDVRQQCIAEELSKKHMTTLIRCLDDVHCDFDVLVLPLKGCNDQYQVPLKQGLLQLDEYCKYHSNLILFCGIENPWLNQVSKRVTYLMSISSVVEENAELTAQGVLAELVKHVDKNFKQLTLDVIGYGNCGKCIVRLLKDIVQGVRIIVKREHFTKVASSVEQEVVVYDEWITMSPSQVIINTAPAPVITKEMMNRWEYAPIILDIASHQGGVNYEVARIKNIPAYLLPSLPPIYTPVSAGRILANAILKELDHE